MHEDMFKEIANSDWDKIIKTDKKFAFGNYKHYYHGRNWDRWNDGRIGLLK